jgi:hypothetical protein
VVASTTYYYRIYATSSGSTQQLPVRRLRRRFGPTAVPTGVTATAVLLDADQSELDRCGDE